MTAAGCAGWQEAVSARLDGELAPAESRRLDQHLAACASCRRFAGEAEALHRATRIRPAEAVPDLSDAIVDRSERRTRRGRSVAAAAAVVLVVACVAAALTSMGGASGPAPVIARIDGVATAARQGTSAAVYLSVVNEGGGDRLTGVRTSSAEATALHATESHDGVVVMTDAADRPIAAKATTILGPGGAHVMLTGVHTALEPGQEVEVTLDFARSESRTIHVTVVAAADVPGDLRIAAT